MPNIKNIKYEAEKLYSHNCPSMYTGVIKPKAQIDVPLIKSKKRWITRVLLSLIMQQNTQTTIIRKLSSHDRYAGLQKALYEYNKIFKSTHVLNMINDLQLRKAIKAARNRTEAYHQLQGMIRKIYQGIFKGKRIIDNRISSHATRLLANCVIAYNATLLNSLYEKMMAEGVPESVIKQFARISPIAWSHIIFTGRYSFRKNNSQIDLKGVLDMLEAQLRTTLWKKDKK
jgi:TnpA family transposase